MLLLTVTTPVLSCYLCHVLPACCCSAMVEPMVIVLILIANGELTNKGLVSMLCASLCCTAGLCCVRMHLS